MSCNLCSHARTPATLRDHPCVITWKRSISTAAMRTGGVWTLSIDWRCTPMYQSNALTISGRPYDSLPVVSLTELRAELDGNWRGLLSGPAMSSYLTNV
jgi:hypothetical protein